MAGEKRIPARPCTRYPLLEAGERIRSAWNRILVSLAVRLITILYALLQFLLSRCRGE
ncbi:MAG: hypothetical protein JXB06_12230 [Spirochaetales bacterium]|nr:hypothetical protein [Spirochaetales bacterium]